jgi:hypothetical protein
MATEKNKVALDIDLGKNTVIETSANIVASVNSTFASRGTAE